MKNNKAIKLVFLLSLIFLASCNSLNQLTAKRSLQIGVSTHYPPVIFEKEGDLQGIEIDFANALGKELNAQITFKVYPGHPVIRARDRL